MLRATTDGAKVVLGDVARVELGAQSYGFINRENGKNATAAAVSLPLAPMPSSPPTKIATRLDELSLSLPAGMSYSIPFNTAPYVKVSIEKVLYTLL